MIENPCWICGKETELPNVVRVCFECAHELGIRSSHELAKNPTQHLGNLATRIMQEMRVELMEGHLIRELA